MEVAGRVADVFEQRIREHEERALAPLAVRSYETQGRERKEDTCSVRTPFQRDRDRIVHSKPFRRLKGKTQVFIDPQGDHYRTRMTHTLETMAISRVVARALRLNEDLVEAIGLGHDMGHTPFGHAGEDALDAAVQRRFGRRFHHNEQSFRIARALNLTHEVCDGILTHTGAVEPETLEGAIVRVVDRVAYINHDIDNAVRYGLLREQDLPREELNVLGTTGSEKVDTLVHDLIETSARSGAVRQSDEVGEAMLALRAFMFEHVYLGPRVEPEHRRVGDVIEGIVDVLVHEPERLPPGAGELAERVVDYVAGMTDRFALGYPASLGSSWPVSRKLRCGTRSPRPTWSRSSPHGRRYAAPRARVSWGAVPSTRSGRRASPSTRWTSFYYCFGCGKGGDVVSFVRETENLDFVGAIEWLAERFRVPIEYEESSPHAEQARQRRERLFAVLDQAAGFFERHLWDSTAGEPVRDYLASRGISDETAREFRLGLAPGRGLAQKARERGFTSDELQAAGLVDAGRRQLPAAPDVPAYRRARPHRPVPGAQAACGRPASRQVSTRRKAARPQVRRPVRDAPCPLRDRPAGSSARREGTRM